MVNDKQDDFVEVIKQLGDDFKYFDAIPAEYTAYVLTVLPNVKALIANVKYNAKYLLSITDEVTIDERVRTAITKSFVQSEKAKQYNIDNPVNVQSQ